MGRLKPTILFLCFISLSAYSAEQNPLKPLNLSPKTPYEKFLVTKIDLASSIINNSSEKKFFQLYQDYYPKFKDFISIDDFAKKVLGNYYKKLSNTELKNFENTYFAYILLLIKQLKDARGNHSSISFYKEKNSGPQIVPVGVKITVSEGSDKKDFKLIFLMDKKTKELKNAIFRNEDILASHKKQFDANLRKLGIKTFLKQFEESTMNEFKKH